MVWRLRILFLHRNNQIIVKMKIQKHETPQQKEKEIEHLSFIQSNGSVSKYGLETFFEKTFNCLKEELQRLRNTIYDYNQHEYIFALNERAWVGAFNNAILRALPDSTVTLQEFGVYDKKHFIGRADFLVYWKDKNNKPLYLLFEAKQYEETIKSELLDDATEYLHTVRIQGQKYFDAEEETEYYKDKNVLVIPIAFGWIRKPDFLNEAKKYFEGGEKKDKSTDFCSLYFEGEHGAWVYGKIYDARESITLLK